MGRDPRARTGGWEFRGRKDRKITYLPFQRRFLSRALKPGVAVAALSVPRGEGKSLLAADLLTEAMPGGCRYLAGGESILLAGSMNQARAVFRFLRERYPCANHKDLKCPVCELRWTDSYQRIGVTHWPTDTRISVRGKSGKLALGLANCPIIVGDEPASWDVLGGQEMIDALITAAGKTQQLLCLIGTLAPGAEGGWWRALVAAGSQPGVYVQSLTGDPDKWASWREVLRVNPVALVNPILREALRREFDEAKRDDRAKARFLSYRLNVPTADQHSVLLTVDEWKRCLARAVPERRGRPVVGVDLGGGRAWSAATALWPSGRCEAIAIAPGVPSLADQEKRDKVARGTYHKLAAAGVLTTDGDRRVPRVSALVERIMPWRPSSVTCDRFRLAELQDAVRGRVLIRPRVQRWSEASEDVRALRSLALDGPLTVEHESRGLLSASLAVANVESDTSGNMRLTKRGSNNTGRDDVAAALVLAGGAHTRRRRGAVGIVRSMLCGEAIA